MIERIPTNIERYRITEGPLKSDHTAGMNGAFFLPLSQDNANISFLGVDFFPEIRYTFWHFGRNVLVL